VKVCSENELKSSVRNLKFLFWVSQCKHFQSQLQKCVVGPLEGPSSEETMPGAQRPLKVGEGLTFRKNEAQERQCELTQGSAKSVHTTIRIQSSGEKVCAGFK
jgi:hypothetical protein